MMVVCGELVLREGLELKVRGVTPALCVPYCKQYLGIPASEDTAHSAQSQGLRCLCVWPVISPSSTSLLVTKCGVGGRTKVALGCPKLVAIALYLAHYSPSVCLPLWKILELSESQNMVKYSGWHGRASSRALCLHSLPTPPHPFPMPCCCRSLA